jgi:hypothetical protein
VGSIARRRDSPLTRQVSQGGELHVGSMVVMTITAVDPRARRRLRGIEDNYNYRWLVTTVSIRKDYTLHTEGLKSP